MSQHSPNPTSPPAPAPLNSQSVPLVKPQQQNKSREIDRIARQLEGLSKSVKRLKETP